VNREGQVWVRTWTNAPFVVLRTAGSTFKAHTILYLDESEPRHESERDKPWEEQHDMWRIA
jgi:hypothetical protein